MTTTVELDRVGKGWSMFGSIGGDPGNWFERWFKTEAAARAYAANRGWVVK